jgi:hypothetical protein
MVGQTHPLDLLKDSVTLADVRRFILKQPEQSRTAVLGIKPLS